MDNRISALTKKEHLISEVRWHRVFNVLIVRAFFLYKEGFYELSGTKGNTGYSSK